MKNTYIYYALCPIALAAVFCIFMSFGSEASVNRLFLEIFLIAGFILGFIDGHNNVDTAVSGINVFTFAAAIVTGIASSFIVDSSNSVLIMLPLNIIGSISAVGGGAIFAGIILNLSTRQNRTVVFIATLTAWLLMRNSDFNLAENISPAITGAASIIFGFLLGGITQEKSGILSTYLIIIAIIFVFSNNLIIDLELGHWLFEKVLNAAFIACLHAIGLTFGIVLLKTFNSPENSMA